MLVRVATILDFVVGLKIYVAGDGESDSVMKKNFSFFKIEKKKVKNIIGVAVCVNLYGSENGVSLTCGGLAEKRRLAEGTST